MAQNENVVFKLILDTSSYDKTLSELGSETTKADKSFKDLNDTISKGAKGMQEVATAKKNYNDLNEVSIAQTKALTAELQNALVKDKEFMAVGKQVSDAYKKGKIDEVQATKLLEDAINKGVDATRKMQVETTKVSNNLKSYRAQIAELKAILPTLQGDEFVKAQAKLAMLTDAMGDQQSQIKLLASDTRALDTAMQGLQLGVGIFAGLQGASALFGSENENVQKALLKVNGAMAVLQSLQAIQNTLDKESGFVNSVKLYWKQLLTTTTIAETTAIEGNVIATEASTLVGAENAAVTATQTASTGAYGVALTVVQAIQTRFAVSSAAAWAIATGGLALLVAGVVALTLALRDSANAQSEYMKTQKLMNDVRKDALTSIVDEKVRLTELLKVANDEYKSKIDRQNAIKKLNEISPEYLGNLTLENIKTIESTTSIGLYLEALNKKAMAEAMYNKRVELNKKIIDAQSKSIDDNITLTDKLTTILIAGGNAKVANALNAGKGAVAKAKEISLIQDEINKLDELGLAQEKQANFKGKLKSVALGGLGAQDKPIETDKTITVIAPVKIQPKLEVDNKPITETNIESEIDRINRQLKDNDKLISKPIEVPIGVEFSDKTGEALHKRIEDFRQQMHETFGVIQDENIRKVFDGLGDIATTLADTTLTAQKKVKGIVEGTSLVFSALVDIGAKAIDKNIANFDKQIEAQRTAVDRAKDLADKGNAQLYEAELKKLTKLEELRRNEAQKKKQSAIGQAVINTAVAVTSALTTQPFLPLAPILAALAAASGAVQIGIISSQQFAKGGFTGDGSGQRDNTGHIPVGIVHDNEFVLDKSYTTQNRKELEYIHKNRINIADLMTMPNLTMNPILSNYHVNELGELKKEMKEVKEAIQHGFKHMPQAEMHADIRGLSIVTRKTNEREKHWRR